MEENNLKVTLSVIGVSLLLVIGVVYLVQFAQKPVQVDQAAVLGEAKHTIGDPNAQITLVEFSDFQCPACMAFAPTIKKFANDYQSQAKLVFRHFALPQHQNARYAAYAAEAAGNQGKFWEVHDWLFENQSSWEGATVSGEYFFDKFGAQFSLDQTKFAEDYKSNEVRDRVANDGSAANQFKLNSTPSVFINGKLHSKVLTYDELVELSGVSQDSSTTSTPTPGN